MIRTIWVGAGVVAVAVAVALVPLPVVLGAGRLAALAILVVGASLTVGRAGVVDLGAGAVAGVGAYLGGALAGLRGWPVAAGLVLALLAGAATGALVTAVAGRVGRTLSAVTSLAAASAIVAGLAAWPAAGGAAGFHAVPLLTGSDRFDLALVLALLVAVAVVAHVVAGGPVGARASVAVHSPSVARSLGRAPTRDAAVLGAVSGAILGVGGAAGAALTGSVVPAAYGLPLSAALALAAVVGGALPAGPLLGVLLVWGPGTLWPLVPVIGDAPALLVMGPGALAIRAWRGGPLVPWQGPVAPTGPPPGRPEPRRMEPTSLEVSGFPLRDGSRVDLEVDPGTATVVVGPNGAGKSTLLAAVAGQVPDHGSVRWGGQEPPDGAARRARRGLARTWQQAPAVPLDDALAVAAGDASDRREVAAIRGLLGPHADSATGRQLLVLAARRPALVLLDEPAAELPVATVMEVVRWLTAAGAAVVVVEHRAGVAEAADCVVRVGREVDGD